MNPCEPLYLQDTLRKWEAHAEALALPEPLMEQAGRSAATLAAQIASDRRGTIVVVAGSGNNGGDGLVLARILHEQGIACRVAALDLQRGRRGDAGRAFQRAQTANLPFGAMASENLSRAALVVDAIYGTGLNRAPEGAAKRAIEAINQAGSQGVPILALDLPSGLMADTGNAPGGVVKASTTITFLGAKPGLYTCQGPDQCGHIVIEKLSPAIDLATPGFISAPAAFTALLAPRRLNSNKGSFGTVAVIGGAQGTAGAALLSGRAALYIGAGKVFVMMPGEAAPPIDLLHPELMMRTSVDFAHCDAVAIGPGLGTSPEAKTILSQAIASKLPAVFDADALNLVASDMQLAKTLSLRDAAALLTPHPLEAARLLQWDVARVQNDRIACALEIARRFQAVVILKGAGSVIASPDGRFAINPTGNPGLASGGTGDVLSGVLGGLAAKKKDIFETALAGCYLHGEAADALVRKGIGPIGMTASELIPQIRACLNHHLTRR